MKLAAKIFLIFSCFMLKINCKSKENYLLLVISLDGFRDDYLDRYSNDNGFLKRFSQTGFKAAWSESIFPANTYPNHWSIVTGLYPESHGIINNHVYDPIINKRFLMAKDREDSEGWFQQAEPVWIKNQKFNKGKQSVIFDWPGAPAVFDYVKPFVSRQFNSEFKNFTFFNKTVESFVDSLEKDVTNFAFLYFNEPDAKGHGYGPESKQVEHVVKELDYVLEYLFFLLKTRKNYDIDNEIDCLIVTDHGMASVRENIEDTSKFIYLSDYFNISEILQYENCNYGPLAELWFKNEKNDLENVYNKIKNDLKSEDKKKIRGIYLKKDIPERFHLKNSYRVAPLVLTANIGYQIVMERNKKFSITKQRAQHGYEPNDIQMRGIFLAKGKSFKRFYRSHEPVHLIDIYSLLCKLLNLTPNPNNGTLSRIDHVLADEDEFKTSLSIFIKLSLFILISLFFYFLISSLFRRRIFLVNTIYLISVIIIFILYYNINVKYEK